MTKTFDTHVDGGCNNGTGKRDREEAQGRLERHRCINQSAGLFYDVDRQYRLPTYVLLAQHANIQVVMLL